MNIIRGVKSPAIGHFVFPVRTEFFETTNEDGVTVRNLGIEKDSKIIDKSKKLGIYSDESVKVFLDFINTVNDEVSSPRFYSYFEGTVYLPENPDILRDYIKSAQEDLTDNLRPRKLVMDLSRGLPIFGNDGSQAFIDRATYQSTTSHMGNSTLFNSQEFAAEYHPRLADLKPVDGYYYYGGEDSIFAESLLILPTFLCINDFLEHGLKGQSLREFLLIKDNWNRINEYFKDGVFPQFKYTKELSRAFFNKSCDNRSFLYPSKNGSVAFNKVSELERADFKFWVSNYEKEFLGAPNDKLKNHKLDLWLEYVKTRGKLGNSDTIVSNRLITSAIKNLYTDKFKDTILPSILEKHGEETANNLDKTVTKIIQKLVKNTDRKKETISFMLYVIKSKNPEFDINNFSLFTLVLLFESLSKPGVFFKGGGTANLEAVMMETLEVFDYDHSKLADILFFLATDSTIPIFNKSQWVKFIQMVKSQNLEDGSNLAIYASIVIPNTRGKNESATQLDNNMLKALRDTERSLELTIV